MMAIDVCVLPKFNLPIPPPEVLEDGEDLSNGLALDDGPEPVIPYAGYSTSWPAFVLLC